MEGKYAVKLSITYLIKISRNKCGLTPTAGCMVEASCMRPTCVQIQPKLGYSMVSSYMAYGH